MSAPRRPLRPATLRSFSIPLWSANNPRPQPPKARTAAVNTTLQENTRPLAAPRPATPALEWTQTPLPTPADAAPPDTAEPLCLVTTPSLSPVLSTSTSATDLGGARSRSPSGTSRRPAAPPPVAVPFAQRVAPPNARAAEKKPQRLTIQKTPSQATSIYGFGEPTLALFHCFSLFKYPRVGAQHYTVYGAYQRTAVFFVVAKGLDNNRRVRQVVPKNLRLLAVRPPLFYCEFASRDTAKDETPLSVQAIVTKYARDAVQRAEAKLAVLKTLVAVDYDFQETTFETGRVVGRVAGFRDCLHNEASYLVQSARRCFVALVTRAFAEAHFFDTPNAYFDCQLTFLRDVCVGQAVVSVYRALN